MDGLSTQENSFAQSAFALVQDWIGTRMRISFLLDVAKNCDCETFEIIQAMKAKREFRRSVILGLRIVWEAGQGKFDTLIATYPCIIEKLQVKSTPLPPTDNSDLVNEIAQLRRLILEQG